MRLAMLAPVFLSGCVFLGNAPPKTAAAPDAPPPTVHVEFAGLFGGQAARTLWNNAVDRQGLMDRVVLDEESFSPYDDDSGTEPWTLQLLLSRLGTGGSTVLTEPVGLGRDTVHEDGTTTPAPTPTSAIRNLRFLSGSDEFPAVVEVVPTGLQVRSRVREDEASLCGDDYTLPVGFVYLRGTLQKLPLGEVVAVYDELALTPAPAVTSIDAVLPSPDDPAFCEALTTMWHEDDTLAQRDAGYVEAAGTVLDMALGPVMP